MTVSVCKSNQVIPFVTLFDADGTKLAIIVEPEYEIKNLVGGKYRFEVAEQPGLRLDHRGHPGVAPRAGAEAVRAAVEARAATSRTRSR